MSRSPLRFSASHPLILLIAATLLGFAGGCSSSEEGPTGPDTPAQTLAFEGLERSAVKVETIDQGAFGNIEEEALHVIRTQDEFTSFWNSLHGEDPQHEVNFSEKIVIAAVIGERSTGGYEAKIESITENVELAGVDVTVTEIEPGPKCAVTQAKTVPYHIVKMDAPSTDQIRFQSGDSRIKSCE
jgi:hypothetical protein